MVKANDKNLTKTSCQQEITLFKRREQNGSIKGIVRNPLIRQVSSPLVIITKLLVLLEILLMVKVVQGVTCKSDFAGWNHNCVLFSDNTIKCWGLNDEVQLGYDSNTNRGDQTNEMGSNLPFVNLANGVKSVSLGAYHSCAAFTDFTAACWGYNYFGQLGQGDQDNRGDESNEMGSYLPPIDLGTNVYVDLIVAGGFHTCILSTYGQLKCWGLNDFAQLGYGDTYWRGYRASEMTDYLDFVDVGSTCSVIVDLSLGSDHTCVLCSNGDVKCFGYNKYGQLGLGHTNNRGDEPFEMSDYLPSVDLGSGLIVSAVYSGFYHNCALFDDGTIKSWGENEKGQLGFVDDDRIGDEPNEMGDDLPFVDVGTDRTVLDVCGGSVHTCAILDDYTVKCWGYNDDRQFGYGYQTTRGDESYEMGDNLPTVDLGTGLTAESIHCGEQHTCAVLNDGSMKCWGRNDFGQLGQGTTDNFGGYSDKMGNNLASIELGTNLTIQECFDLTPY